MLVRKTLDYSEKKSIRLSEEIEYLEKYLTMERMRFNNCFSFNISIENDIKSDYIEIPSLLLQPYVENSVRHGIRNRLDNLGEIKISFTQLNNYLKCTIYDNGVGRDEAKKIKNSELFIHNSKGTYITEKRIKFLNIMNKINIIVEVNDILKKDYSSNGTEVTIKIPV